ncbi:hypothetical protein FRB99_008463 [Tulasnella sp. 403]|nr:hypothetical protein FRB99_008463 [Tulasnella sp. 403]
MRAALYVYGASPEALKTITNGRYLHAHQDICVNDQCYPIDVHQAYLNIDKRDESHPVLIWSYDRFDPTVINTVHLRLLDGQSPDGLEGKGMTFSKAIYSEVQQISPWKVPVPGAKYRSVRVGHKLLTYSPWGLGWLSRNPWYVDHGCHVAWNMVDVGDQPTWTFQFTGYGVKVYGPPKRLFLDVTHASQKVCVDDRCHYIDAEHAYLSVLPEEAHQDVLLWSTFGLELNTKHTISVQLVQRPDYSRQTMMAVSHLEYLTNEYAQSQPSLPPTPTPPPGTLVFTEDEGPSIDPESPEAIAQSIFLFLKSLVLALLDLLKYLCSTIIFVLEVLGLTLLLILQALVPALLLFLQVLGWGLLAVFGLNILVSVIGLVVNACSRPTPVPPPTPRPPPAAPRSPPASRLAPSSSRSFRETDPLVDPPPPYKGPSKDIPRSQTQPPPYHRSQSDGGPSRERIAATSAQNGRPAELRTSPPAPSTRRSRYGTFASPSGNGGGANRSRR